MTDPSTTHVFGRQVEARRYVEAVAARMLTVELAQFEETDEVVFRRRDARADATPHQALGEVQAAAVLADDPKGRR